MLCTGAKGLDLPKQEGPPLAWETGPAPNASVDNSCTPAVVQLLCPEPGPSRGLLGCEDARGSQPRQLS